MLFGSDTTYHPLNTSGNVLSASGDLDEINFRVGGVDLLQLVEDDTQDAVVINKSLSDVDLIVRSATCSGAIVSRGDGSEVVINEDGVDTNFRVESTASDDATPDPGFTHLAHDKEHALFVDGTNGRVGLGTSNPNTTLHVAGSAHIEGDLWIKGVTNQIDTMVHVTSAMDITNTGTGPALEVKQTGAQPVAAFYDDTHPSLFIADGETVGIGTTTPADPLTIKEAVDTGTTTASRTAPHSLLRLELDREVGNAPYAGFGPGLDFWSRNYDGDTIRPNARIVGGCSNASTTHTGGYLSFSTTPTEEATDESDFAEAMRIIHNGRVGVGVWPTSPLYISDTDSSHDSTSLYATLRIDHNHNHGGIVINSTDSKQSHLRFANNGDTRWQIRHPLHDANGPDTLRFYSYTHGDDVMTLSPSGTVGIGIDFPVVSLNVDSTDALRVPVGNVAQRPAQAAFGIDPADTLGDGTGGTTNAASMLGMIRYNTENSTFEGFGPGYTWGSLGGVIDVDRDTYWTAVNDLNNVHVDEFDLDNTGNSDPYNTYPGDTDYLRAFTSGLKRFAIADDGDVRFYKKTSGDGTTANYVYTTYLDISHETASNKHGAVIESGSGDITLKPKTGTNSDHGIVNIDGHNGSNHGLALAGTLVKATAAELNIMDGHTAATSVTVADTDRVVYNDDGIMKQVAVTNLTAYFDHKITTMPNLTSIGGTNKAVTVKDTLTVGTMGALEPGDAEANPAVPASPILNTTFVLNVGGNIRADGDVIAFATSDERLKDNRKPIADPLSKISTLTGYEFDWNDRAEFHGHDVGVLAQEVEKVLPEIVTTRESGFKAIKYEKLVPLLIEGIKEQNEKINSLEARVEQLIEKIETL